MNYRYFTPARNRTFGQWGSNNLLIDLNRQINRVFDDLFDRDDDDRIFNRTATQPAMDVTAEDDFYEITAELPGVRQDDLNVAIDDGVLTIAGEKRSRRERDDDDTGFYERSFGRFERQMTLPRDIDGEKISADFEDGVLTITIPKAEEAGNSRKIAINSGDYRKKPIDTETTQEASGS